MYAHASHKIIKITTYNVQTDRCAGVFSAHPCQVCWACSRLHHECVIGPHDAENCQYQPDYNNYSTCNPARGFSILHGFLCPCSALSQNGIGDQLDSQGDTHWYQDKIIQIAKNRNKVRDQINGAEGISDDASHDELCIPRRSGITRSKVKGKGLCLEMTRTLFQFCEQCHIVVKWAPNGLFSRRPLTVG